MKPFARLIQQKNIRYSVVFFILIIFFLIIASLIIIHQYETHEILVNKELQTISDLKSEQISHWYFERSSDAKVAMNNQMLGSYLYSYKNSEVKKRTSDHLYKWLESLLKEYHYKGIILLDSNGNRVLSIPDNQTANSNYISKYLPVIETLHEPFSTDLYYDPESDTINLEFWCPIRDLSSDEFMGILILGIDPYDYLYPLIQTWPVESDSAESLITREDESEIIFLNDLRHAPNAALKLRIPLSMENVPAVMAAKGYQGIVKGNDYREIPVIAAITSIPGTPWNLVTKIDIEEINAPFREYVLFVIGIILLLIILSAFILWIVWTKQESEYIRKELEQKQNELILADRVRLLMKQANDAIFILNADWNIIDVNEKALQNYGYSKEEFLKMNLKDIRSETAKSRFSQDIQILNNPDGVTLETEHQRKNGTIFPVENSIRTINMNGTVLRQCIIRDFTERKAYEKEILEKNVELESINEEITATYEELTSQEEELRHQMEMIKHNEVQLQELQNRLYEAQRAGHVGTWELYPDTKQVWSTEEGYSIFGIKPKPDGLISIETIEACLEEKDLISKDVTNLVEHNIPINNEFVIHPADGSPPRILTSVGQLIRDEHGNPKKIIGVIQDVTERRDIERTLKTQEEKISAFFNSPLIGIVFGDLENNIAEANQEFFRITGYTREDIEEDIRNLKTITPYEFADLDRKKHTEALETGVCSAYEKQLVKKDGTRIWVLVGYVYVGSKWEESVLFILDISRLKENEEKIQAMNIYLEEKVTERTNQLEIINEELQSEVEERIHAEEQIQEALSLLNAALESTADGLCIVDMQQKISKCNKIFIEMWNLPDKLLESCDTGDMFEFIKDLISDPQPYLITVQKVRDSPDQNTFNTLYLDDGRVLEVYSKPQVVNNSITGTVWSFRDVSKRKQMEQQIEKSLREKEVLLKEIHHRVKNNMQVVSSLLYMQSRLVTDENFIEILRESQNRVKSIALVHEELYQSMDLDRIDYISYIRKLSRFIFDSYKVSKENITLDIIDNKENIFVSIDKAIPCSLIVSELISNSIKHAFVDGRKGTIKISLIDDKIDHILTYSDNGIGISQEKLEQKKTLGLQLIEGLVKQINGRIMFQQNGETHYTICFPK